jgi:CO/xanthine dehydrogenase Mo-binding subunit
MPKSLIDNPRLDRWLAFGPDGRVRLAVGKVELGQGIMTALAQIAAEELDVELKRLDIVAGDTDAAPDEGMTTGSMSIEMSGASVRIVCAETRALFVSEAARRLNCAPAEISVRDGSMLRGGEPTGQDYWTLSPSVPLARDLTGAATAKPPAQHRVVGTALPRLDLPAKIFGAGFIQDLDFPRMLHARMLRQPRPDATLASFDEAAMRRAGAIQIIRRGNFLAAVAEDETAARAAAANAKPVWRGAVATAESQQEAAHLRDLHATEVRFGAPPSGQESIQRYQATYSRPYIAHASIGPSCAIAQFRAGHLTVWSHTQGVYPLRNVLAEITGLVPTAISVRHVHGAGCYGHNGADDVAFDAAVIALETAERPVRVQWSREDEFAYEPVGSAMVVRLDVALDQSGRPHDWTTEIWSAPHTMRGRAATTVARMALPDPPEPPPAFEIPPENGGGATRNAVPIYDVGARRILLHLVQPPQVRTSALRALGGLPNVFAIESMLDELAAQAGADPLAYRLSLLSDARARRVLERAAQMADWTSRGPAGGGTGLGLGFARYKNRSAYAAVIAEVEVETEVRVRRVWCAADAGVVINPDGAINQLEGGIIMAASMTLKEQVRFGESGIGSITWDEYPILRFSEVPEIHCTLVDARDEPPLGMGECTMGPTAAAIGNAVAHALGARIRDMPLTRDRIAAALLAERDDTRTASA